MQAKIGQLPARLSGGEKQRVAIARALVRKPRIVLCDEPTGNLDEETGEEILELFTRLHEEDRTTFLIVTHEERAAAVAETVLVMKRGKLVYRDTGEPVPPPEDLPPGDDQESPKPQPEGEV